MSRKSTSKDTSTEGFDPTRKGALPGSEAGTPKTVAVHGTLIETPEEKSAREAREKGTESDTAKLSRHAEEDAANLDGTRDENDDAPVEPTEPVIPSPLANEPTFGAPGNSVRPPVAPVKPESHPDADLAVSDVVMVREPAKSRTRGELTAEVDGPPVAHPANAFVDPIPEPRRQGDAKALRDSLGEPPAIPGALVDLKTGRVEAAAPGTFDPKRRPPQKP